MKSKHLLTLPFFCASVVFLSLIVVDRNSQAADEASATTIPFSYAQPGDALPSRVGGSSRGVSGAKLQVLVMAPDHTGLTTREQPTLYWYQSDPTDNDIEITIVDDNQINPVFETKLSGSQQAGIHPVSLKDFNVKLKEGIEYRWFVAVITDKTQRSTDIITGGTIKRINKSKLNNGAPLSGTISDKVSILASKGIWYDAIDTLSAEIDKTGSPALKETRNKLLTQVGLGDAVDK